MFIFLGIFHIPRQEHNKSQQSAIPLTLICDNIRDPGNMGTVLRCAASVGCKEVIVMKGR
jgi:tRNA G18 (ribose-2'-O)-methylase SpoU